MKVTSKSHRAASTPAEQSAMLDVYSGTLQYAIFEDADETMWQYVFPKHLVNAATKVIALFPRIKYTFVGILLVFFWSIFVNLTVYRQA